MLALTRSALRERFVRWALRVRVPEPAPIILTQRRVYVLPTRAGLAFGCATVLMLVTAINYNLSLGYVLTFLLGGLGVSAILHTFRNLAGLRILPGRCEPVFAGEEARFPIVIENQRDDARYGLQIHLPTQTPQSAQIIDIGPNTIVSTTLMQPALQRGWLSLQRLTIATTHPLGLIRAWSYAVPEQRCLIYPAPATDAPPIPYSGGDKPGQAPNSRGGLEDFSGLRDYQRGDPPRHVAWKAVARLDGTLLTKEFTADAARFIHLEWDSLPPGMAVEHRLSVLARWVCQAYDQGLSWSLHLPGASLPMAGGDAHYHASLKALALHDA